MYVCMYALCKLCIKIIYACVHICVCVWFKSLYVYTYSVLIECLLSLEQQRQRLVVCLYVFVSAYVHIIVCMLAYMYIPILVPPFIALCVSSCSSLGLRAHLRSAIVMATPDLKFPGYLCLFQHPCLLDNWLQSHYLCLFSPVCVACCNLSAVCRDTRDSSSRM